MFGSRSREHRGEKGGGVDSDRARRLGFFLIAVICVGEVAFSWWDGSNRLAEQEARTTRRLEQTATLAHRLYLAELKSIDARMERLRGRVRGLGVWDDPDLGQPSRPATDAEEVAPDATTRRLLASLEHALDQWPGAVSLDVVVAGHRGLWAHHLDRAGTKAEDASPVGRSAEAKALWYDEQVRRAVDSGGRGVEHGEISFVGQDDAGAEDRPATPITRVAIALHQPGEIVQGALVVSLNATHWAAPIERAAPEEVEIVLVSSSGRRLVPDVAAADDGARYASLVKRVFESASPAERIEADGRWIVGTPLTPGGDALATLFAFAETPALPRGPLAWLATAHLIAWIGLALLAVIAGRALAGSRDRIVHYEVMSSPTDSRSEAEEASQDLGPGQASPLQEEIAIDMRAFRIHDWLSDVRACLEREAARRGLGLSLRCERGVPDEFTSDAGWLGGLVLALGREALDATDSENVVLDVYEERADALRFEITAGSIDLAPAHGMQEIAREIGADFTTGHGGRLALVVPSAITAH